MAATSIDQQFIEFIVKSLVGYPDDVIVDRSIDEKGVLLTLTVNPEDLGRVIGKRGTTAQSLRSLLRALGTKNDARYNLKIVDVDRPESERDQPREKNEDVKKDEISDEQSDADEIVEADEKRGESSDLATKTRQELAELDDLDI